MKKPQIESAPLPVSRFFVADNLMGGPKIVLKGGSVHRAKFGMSAHGAMRSIEYAEQSLDEVAAELTERIADTRKRLAGFGSKLTNAPLPTLGHGLLHYCTPWVSREKNLGSCLGHFTALLLHVVVSA